MTRDSSPQDTKCPQCHTGEMQETDSMHVRLKSEAPKQPHRASFTLRTLGAVKRLFGTLERKTAALEAGIMYNDIRQYTKERSVITAEDIMEHFCIGYAQTLGVIDQLVQENILTQKDENGAFAVLR